MLCSFCIMFLKRKLRTSKSTKNMSHFMSKPIFCICRNKGTDQLCGYREADQRLCFCYTDSTIPLLSKSIDSSFQPSSVTAQTSLCLCLHRLVCVGPGRKPHCWFSRVTAHMCILMRYSLIYMSRLVEKPTMWFPNRSDTNQPVQLQKQARSLKFWS